MTARSCPGRKAWCPSCSRAWNTSAGASADAAGGQHGPEAPSPSVQLLGWQASAHLLPAPSILAGRVVARVWAGRVAQAQAAPQAVHFPHLLRTDSTGWCGSPSLGWHHPTKMIAV